MSTESLHRRLLLAASVVGYAIVFAAFVVWERPSLGLGHFYYIPVALAALAGGARRGTIAGLVATALFVLGVYVNRATPSPDILTLATAIRLANYTAIGALVGYFANTNQSLVQRLSVAAERDFLTNLLNARAFEAALEARVEGRQPFALVLGDMDGLKGVNDEHGHAAGNDALRLLAEGLVEHSRRGDTVARVGGDEFAILTPVDDTGEGRAIVRRLEENLIAQGLRISFGYAIYPADGTSALSLFREADARLYDRKLVRNRLASGGELRLLPSAIVA